MSIKQSKSTICSQDSIQTIELSQRKINFVQVYRIKVEDLRNKNYEKNIERNIYLNIKFDDEKQTVIQTQCIQIIKNNQYFQIKTKYNIQKIEVLDYDQLKKLSKISLKGINKEFKHTHLQEKNQIQILIERTHVSLALFQKNCKLNESVMIDGDSKTQDQCDSTDDSSSEVSV